MNQDLELGLQTLQAKQPHHQRAWDYYEGRHPLIYSSARLQQVFRRLDARFTLNWCAVAVDSTAERIQLRRLSSPQSRADRQLAQASEQTQLALEANEIHRMALVTGESYLFAWREGVADPLEIYAHDGRRCHLFHDPEHPRRKTFAVKRWHGGAALYYADHWKRFVGSGDKARIYRLEREGINPFGEVPVFAFRRERRAVIGELETLYELQDAVNKLLNDLMIGSEFGVFAQRYVVSNADVGTLKNAPSEIWQIPAADDRQESTQVGQFAPVSLNHFLEPLADLAAAIAVISRTPRHYFLRSQGEPSGEALLAQEAPLVRKAERLIAGFRPVWSDVGQFLLKLQNQAIAPVEPIFEPVQTVNPRMRAELRELNVRAGMPLLDYLRLEEGWSPDRLESLPPN